MERKMQEFVAKQSISLAAALEKKYRAAWNESKTYIALDKKYHLMITWNEEADWSAYSKSYGRPKNTYSNRRVELRWWDCSAGYWAAKTFPVDRFSPGFLEKAIAALFRIREKNEKRPHIQLSRVYRTRLMRTMGQLRIYQRTLAGYVAGYAAVLGTTTYHASTPKRAVRGLSAKRKTSKIAKSEKINWEYGLALGFCEPSLTQFCADTGLEPTQTYSRVDIAKKITKQIKKTYCHELKTAGF